MRFSSISRVDTCWSDGYDVLDWVNLVCRGVWCYDGINGEYDPTVENDMIR